MKLVLFLVLVLIASLTVAYHNHNRLRLVSHINVTNYYKEVYLPKEVLKGDTVIINTMPFIVQD